MRASDLLTDGIVTDPSNLTTKFPESSTPVRRHAMPAHHVSGNGHAHQITRVPNGQKYLSINVSETAERDELPSELGPNAPLSFTTLGEVSSVQHDARTNKSFEPMGTLVSPVTKIICSDAAGRNNGFAQDGSAPGKGGGDTVQLRRRHHANGSKHPNGGKHQNGGTRASRHHLETPTLTQKAAASCRPLYPTRRNLGAGLASSSSQEKLNVESSQEVGDTPDE